MDHFMKWSEVFAVKEHTAQTVARLLCERVFSRFEMPRQLLSDRGPEFESRLFSEICSWMGIQKIRTTAYKPSTNGMVERFHRTLNAMIGKVVAANQRDWDERLQTVVAAYRASVHEATGYTPNLLMLNREV
jgi:transposase InsO family protein